MVIDDIDKVKELQKDHGEWSECMSNVSNLLPHKCHVGASHKSSVSLYFSSKCERKLIR